MTDKETVPPQNAFAAAPLLQTVKRRRQNVQERICKIHLHFYVDHLRQFPDSGGDYHLHGERLCAERERDFAFQRGARHGGAKRAKSATKGVAKKGAKSAKCAAKGAKIAKKAGAGSGAKSGKAGKSAAKKNNAETYGKSAPNA